MNPSKGEIDLIKRRIVRVLDYFDEECDIPWNYIQRAGDGRYEAIATILLDSLRADEPGIARDHSVGIFDRLDEAIERLRQFLKQVERARYETLVSPDGTIDLNLPKTH